MESPLTPEQLVIGSEDIKPRPLPAMPMPGRRHRVETWRITAACPCVSTPCVSTTATTAAPALRGSYRTFSEPGSRSLAAAPSAGHFGGPAAPATVVFLPQPFPGEAAVLRHAATGFLPGAQEKQSGSPRLTNAAPFSLMHSLHGRLVTATKNGGPPQEGRGWKKGWDLTQTGLRLSGLTDSFSQRGDDVPGRPSQSDAAVEIAFMNSPFRSLGT